VYYVAMNEKLACEKGIRRILTKAAGRILHVA
jgi:hypothetical protein